MKRLYTGLIIVIVAIVVATGLYIFNSFNHFDLRIVRFTTTVESISLTENESVIKTTLRVTSHEDLTGESNKSILTDVITTTFLRKDLAGVQVGGTLDLICKMDFRYEPVVRSCFVAPTK